MKFTNFLMAIFLFIGRPYPAMASTLQKVLEKYAKASSISTDIRKTDEKIILGTKSESTGVLKFQKNKIYIAQNGEKKVELFYSDKVLTLVEYPDADFDKKGNRKITTLKKNIPPLINSLLNLFSDPKKFNKEFVTISDKKENGLCFISLKPSQKALKNFNLTINIKNLQVVGLSFVDDVDTKTTIEFDNTKLNTKLNKTVFQFTKLTTDEEMFE